MRQADPAPVAARSGHAAGRETLGLRRGFFHLPAWARENLEHSLPFLLGGALCIGLAVWLHLSQPAQIGSHVSLWMLLAAVGVTLGGGGLALTLVDEPSAEGAPEGTGDYVMVERSAWEAWQAAGAPPPTMPPAPEPAPPWDESAPTEPGLPATGSIPTPYDSTLVATVSDDLLRAQRPFTASAPRGPAVPPAAPVAAASRPSDVAGAPEGIGAPPMAPAPAPPGIAPGARARPSISPVWQEDAIHELESVLEQFGRGPVASLPAAKPGAPPPSIDRCIACGAIVTGYSEQACVVCDRPLCDRCLERSVAEGRPAVCPTCPPPQEG